MTPRKQPTFNVSCNQKVEREPLAVYNAVLKLRRIMAHSGYVGDEPRPKYNVRRLTKGMHSVNGEPLDDQKLLALAFSEADQPSTKENEHGRDAGNSQVGARTGG